MTSRRLLCGLALLLCLGAAPPHAETPFYFGLWKIASAVPAPWANKNMPPDREQMEKLVGRSLKISATGIDGPRDLACRDVRYELHEFTADMLFQGELAESRDGKPADPYARAAALGFRGSNWKTLDTGCENEIDLHFLTDQRAAFALNNYVYYLEKQ